MKISKFFCDSLLSVSSNLFSFAVGALVLLLVPKLIGVEEYSNYQLYNFYLGFVGLFHFGWSDGFFLKYAGKDQKEFHPSVITGHLFFFSFFEFFLWIVIFVVFYRTCTEDSSELILYSICVSAFLILVNNFLRLVMQCSRQFAEYSFSLSFERLLFLLFIAFFFFYYRRNYSSLIFAFILSQTFALFLSVFLLRDKFTRSFSLSSVLPDIKSCTLAGLVLMLSGILPMIIIGTARLGIEKHWGLIAFGKVSLLLSTVSILFVFVYSVASVLLPTLRSSGRTYVLNSFLLLRSTISWLLLFSFVFARLAQLLLSWWLPEYADFLLYLPFVIPICFFQGVSTLTTETYLKTFRKEILILLGNFIAFFCACLLFYVSIYLLNSLKATIITIVLAMALRLFVLDFLLSLSLGIRCYDCQCFECLAIFAFLILHLFSPSLVSSLLYAFFLVALFVYWSSGHRDILHALYTLLRSKIRFS